MKNVLIDMNLRQKLRAGLTLYIFFYILIGFSTYMKFETFQKDVTVLIHAIKLSNICLEIRRYEKNFIIRLDANEYQTAKKYIDKAIIYVKRVQGYFSEDGSSVLLKNLEIVVKEYQIAFSSIQLSEGIGHQEVHSIVQEKILTKGKEMIRISDELVSLEQENLSNYIKEVKVPIIATLALLILFTVVWTLLLFRQLIAPLRSIENAANTIAKGTFVPMKVPGRNDELTRVLLAFNRMVDELEEKQEQLIQAQKLSSIGTLASGTAHQLNNPLNNVSTSCQIAISELQEGHIDKVGNMLELICQETNRAGEIVKGLLEFSRVQNFSLKPVNLSKPINMVLNLIEGEVPPGVTIKKDIKDDLIVDLDLQKMTEALLNLVINGIQAISDPPGTVSITVFDKKPTHQAVIAIEDSGCGIDPTSLKSIFDPFYTTKKVGKGTGLGLSVAYGIIKKHNGTIDVQSAPGEGARFDITLPLSANQQLHQEELQISEGKAVDDSE